MLTQHFSNIISLKVYIGLLMIVTVFNLLQRDVETLRIGVEISEQRCSQFQQQVVDVETLAKEHRVAQEEQAEGTAFSMQSQSALVQREIQQIADHFDGVVEE